MADTVTTAAEIAAYVGAGAWLPQIATWIYHAVVRPVITIVPERTVEVGFTSFGPIFNLRLALASKRADAVIDGIELDVRHADGATRILRWAGLKETLSEVRDQAGLRQQVVERDEVPVALKLGTTSLVQRFVRFQEPAYHDSLEPLMSDLVAHFNHLKRTDPEFVTKTIASQEIHTVIEARKQSFWWKPGKYSLRFSLNSLDRISVRNDQAEFTLTASDIERLRANLDVLKIELENLVKSNIEDQAPPPIVWNWVNTNLRTHT